ESASAHRLIQRGTVQGCRVAVALLHSSGFPPRGALTMAVPSSEPTHQCDLVMKGGITSGVVYPAAVLELQNRYRFRCIGGTSVGAMAAAATAAAEYGREHGGFNKLRDVSERLSEPGFIRTTSNRTHRSPIRCCA